MTAGAGIADARAEYVAADFRHGHEASDPREPIELASLAPESTTGGAVAAEIDAAANDAAPKDVNYFRRRGAAAYRNGDLAVALANFDLAIQHDTSCSDCYVDRGIVLHRMGDLKGAFADVNEARRLDAAHRAHPDVPAH